jgi:hypothetical protein
MTVTKEEIVELTRNELISLVSTAVAAVGMEYLNPKISKEEQDKKTYCDGIKDASFELFDLEEKVNEYLITLPTEVIKWAIPSEEGMAGKIWVARGKDGYSTHVMCNDLFIWACADAEAFSLEDIDSFRECLSLSENYGTQLWVCRKRGMRPQTPYYKHFNDAEKVLFDACGPVRTKESMNW